MSSPRTGSSRDHHHGSRNSRKISKKPNRNPSPSDHEALCHASDAILRNVVSSDEHLSYLPLDFTLDELQAEIALARGLATTIYVKRDGLSTLKVVLPQQDPTIANLKRAIERTANLLQQRNNSYTHPIPSTHRATVTKSSTDTPPRRSGDLIAAASTRAERPHRINASWRFLWRAYALTKAQDPTTTEHSGVNPLPDENGRQLLSDFGIGHKSVLRFVKRENYFGRRRQRS